MKTFTMTPDIQVAEAQLSYTESFLTTGTSSRVVITAAGTAAALNLRGGGVALPTAAATDNSKSGVRGAGNIVLLASKKNAWMAAKLQYAEANTNAANLLVGFSSVALASAIQSDGAGIPANFSGAGFVKTDGGVTNWRVFVSNATTQTIVELNAAASLDKTAKPAASSAYQLLEVDLYCKSDTRADVVFKIDGVTVYKIMDWDITSIAAMAPIAMIMSGSTTPETLNLRRLDFAGVI